MGDKLSPITLAAAKAACGKIDYTTVPHKTGRKWTDGKDIYELSVVKENFSIISNVNFDVVKYADINCDKVLKGHVYSSADNGGGNLDVWESDNDYIRGKSNTNWETGTITITIEYTQQS